jgi:hypothetical protein
MAVQRAAQGSVTTNRDLWAGMKMLMFVGAAILVVSNVIFTIQAVKTGTGSGFGDTRLVPNGQIPGGPATTTYHNGLWSDTWQIAVMVAVDAGLIAFWYSLLSKLKSI